VDKDKNPKWNPASLAGVSANLIETILGPRFEGTHPLADLDPACHRAAHPVSASH
jgi:hypothetical protein